MANFPTITYTNLKHKVSNGISGGVIQTKDEAINIVFNNGIGIASAYKASFNSPHNQITGTLNSNKELTKWEARVTPVENEDYGPTVGNSATLITGISANTNVNFTIPITQNVFYGSPTNTYRICLLGQSSLDYSWDCTQLYMVIDTNTAFTNAYTEVDYIESAGTQYIDSNYIPNINTVIKGKYLHSENSADTPLFGVRAANYSNAYVFWAHPIDHVTKNYKNQMIFNGTAQTFSSGALPYGQINTFYYSKNLFILNNVEMSLSASSGTPNLSLIVFGLRNGASIDGRKFIGRIYEFNISENATAVRDFVPCIRNSDNKPGLYDRANNVFYTNQGSGEFKYGPLKSVPQTYQQVEYLGSSGTQYINTNLVASANTHLQLKTLFNTVANQGVYGGQIQDADTGLRLFTSASALYIAHGGNRYEQRHSLTVNTIYIIDHTHTSFLVNGASTYKTSAGSDFRDTTLTIGRCNGFGGTVYNLNGRIYYCKLWENNNLVRDFIPCYRKSDSVIGLFDLVNNVFYTNAGSGTFTKGSNVNNINHINYKPKDADGYDVHFIN